MNIAALSGVAAKVLVALMMAQGRVEIEEVGEAIGVRRRQTLIAAAQELVTQGVAAMDMPHRGSIFISFLLNQDRPSFGGDVLRTDQEIDTEIELDDRSIESIIYSRSSSFVAPSPTESVVKQQFVLLNNEKCCEASGASQQKVLLNNEKCSLTTQTVNTLIGPNDSDDLLAPVHAADAQPGRNDQDHQPRSPFVLRRKAQVAALQALWTQLLPETPVPRSLDVLVTEAENMAAPVAELIIQVSAKQGVQYPFSYIRKALANQKERQARQPANDDDGWGTIEMTPELAAQAESAARAGKDLWGDD